MAAEPPPTSDPELLPIADPADWEVVPEMESVVAAPRLGTSLSVRLDPDGAQRVRRAAGLSGVTQSEFVRRAALRAADEILRRVPLAITVAPGIPGGDAPRILSRVGSSAVIQPQITSVSPRGELR